MTMPVEVSAASPGSSAAGVSFYERFRATCRVVVLLAGASLLMAATCGGNTSPNGNNDAGDGSGGCQDLPASISVGFGDATTNVAPANCADPNKPYIACFDVNIEVHPHPGAQAPNGWFDMTVRVDLNQICSGCTVNNRWGTSVTSEGAQEMYGFNGDPPFRDHIPWVISNDGHKFWPDGDYTVSVRNWDFLCDNAAKLSSVDDPLLAGAYYLNASNKDTNEGLGFEMVISGPLCGPTGHSSGPGSLLAQGANLPAFPFYGWTYNNPSMPGFPAFTSTCACPPGTTDCP